MSRRADAAASEYAGKDRIEMKTPKRNENAILQKQERKRKENYLTTYRWEKRE